MKRLAAVFLLACVFPTHSFRAADRRMLSKEVFVDKVRGGWAGQMFGVVYGAPTEFKARGIIYDGERVGTPDELKGALDQDDLYVEMTLAEVMDHYGLDAAPQDFGEAFRDAKYPVWHANLAARRNLARGIMPPLSGDPHNNPHANDIDFQIESDFIGLMSPGLPRSVQYFADRVGHVMNYGDGVYGGVFIGAMYAAAYFEDDPHKVVEAGLEAIPAQSQYAGIIRDVLAWHDENPKDWKATWKRIEEKWDKDDPCPEGALAPFNIDAKLNGAYVALGLLYGDKDFERTIDVAARAGQDSDCNPSSAGGILGVILGYKALPARWTEALVPLMTLKFSSTTFTFDGIVASTISRAAAVVNRNGGKVTEDGLEIPPQKPNPMKLEQWDPGKPSESIPANDPRWSWKGEPKRDAEKGFVASDEGDVEASITFEGTGAILVGYLREDGGYADLYVDGVKTPIDGYVAGGNRTSESLWHNDGLRPGQHALRLVISGRRYPRARGAWIYVQRLVVFRK